MTAILASFLFSATQQSPDLRLDYTNPGARFEVLFPDLGRAIQREIKVDPLVQEEIGVLRLHDVPLTEALTKMSDAFDIEFMPTEKGFYVRRTKALRNRRDQRDYETRVRLFQKIQAQNTDEKPEPPETDASALAAMKTFVAAFKKLKPGEDWPQLPASSIQSLCQTKLFQAIDARQIARNGMEQRVVFSTIPTRTQVSMPSAMRSVIQAFLASTVRWKRAFEAATMGLPKSPELESLAKFVDNELNINLPQTAAKAIVTANNQMSRFDSFSLEFLASTGESLADFPLGNRNRNSVDQKVHRPFVWQEDLIEPTPLFKRLVASQDSVKRPELAESELKALLHPELIEPASIGLGPMLVRYGEITKRNIIASPPDYSMLVRDGTSMTAKQFLKSISDDMFDLKTEGQWLTLFPYGRLMEDRLHAPRKRFARYLQHLYGDEPTNLDEQVDYALTACGASPGFLNMAYQPWLIGSAEPLSRSAESPEDMDLIFYRSLSDRQREIMLHGGMALVDLLPTQQEMWRKLIFNKSMEVEVETADEIGGPAVSDMRRRRGATEITELLPNGIPLNSVLTMQDETTLMAKFLPTTAPKTTPRWEFGRSAESLASQLFTQERNVANGKPPKIRTDRVKTFEQRTITLKLQIGPRASAEYDISFSEGRHPKEMAYADLPQAFRDQVATSLKTMKENRADDERKTIPPNRY